MTLFPVVVVVAVAIGYLAGGRLRNFERLQLSWWPLAAVGFGLQLLPVPDLGGDAERAVSVVLVFLSYPPLLLFAGRNAAVVGIPTVLLGITLNFLVIGANGSMPVGEDALEASGLRPSAAASVLHDDPKHHLMEEGDRLTFIADVIGVGAPFRQVVSVGDLVAYVGLGMLTVAVMRGRTPGLGHPGPTGPPVWTTRPWSRDQQPSPAEQLAMWR